MPAQEYERHGNNDEDGEEQSEAGFLESAQLLPPNFMRLQELHALNREQRVLEARSHFRVFMAAPAHF